MYNSTWYQNLVQPPFSLPNWVFTPAWIVLYTTIFIALILYVLQKTDEKKVYGYVYFAIQIILNMGWSPIFFLAENIGAALAIILLLDIFVFLTIRKFYSISKVSGLILLPYFLWIIFATYLNFGYYILN